MIHKFFGPFQNPQRPQTEHSAEAAIWSVWDLVDSDVKEGPEIIDNFILVLPLKIRAISHGSSRFVVQCVARSVLKPRRA